MSPSSVYARTVCCFFWHSYFYYLVYGLRKQCCLPQSITSQVSTGSQWNLKCFIFWISEKEQCLLESYARRSLWSNKYLTNVSYCFLSVFSEWCIKSHTVCCGVTCNIILLGFLDDHMCTDQVHMFLRICTLFEWFSEIWTQQPKLLSYKEQFSIVP